MAAIKRTLGLLAAAFVVAACGGGSGSAGGAEGTFTLIEFLEAGKDSIPRNRVLTFRFSAPVGDAQDFFERLKIENVQTGANSNFSRAIGVYLVTGDEVTFVPKLPENADRSDSGLRKNGQYVVFLKGGPDALSSTDGDRIASPQEFVFDTNDTFEDPIPSEPPRALGLFARDLASGESFEISRIDPSPTTLAAQDNATLIAAGRVIEPGAGGGPSFATPWAFDLIVSEPIDPATVTTANVEMFEIFSDATNTGESAAPGAPAGTFGTPVNFKVPVNVKAFQTVAEDGSISIAIRVTPLFALVDNTRYRIRLSGNILGIDFRKAFIGENGLTGDGLAQAEPGGIGYTSEFIVRDRPAIQGTRAVTFDPLEDGVFPETGNTTNTEALFNSALYNPASSPGTAVGFLPDFGNGADGPLAVGGGLTVTIDTGDTPNTSIGNPFTVTDINPSNEYNKTDLNAGQVTYDSPEFFDMKLASLVVSGSATLRVVGKNPILFRVAGLVQINGTLDVGGDDGRDGFGGNAAGGVAGAGGGNGGDSRRGLACNPGTSACQSWAAFLNRCTNIKNGGPWSDAGEGPGRGQNGAESWSYAYNEIDKGLTGTGGGGGSHATMGTVGEDRRNVGGAPGTPGPACAQGSSSGTTNGTSWVKNSSVIGVRGISGPTYGDREVVAILWGGSGGGAGGTQHAYTSWGIGAARSGGAGGGGGGTLAIFASGPIIATGGKIDVSGGNGGKGAFANAYASQTSWRQASGSGGGGSGGSLVLISGADITLSANVLDARGGEGGKRASDGTTITCNACNAGGAGGQGFIFLMDADGVIEGLLPGTAGQYDGYARGVLTISEFKSDRFSSISAITELFNVFAANPEYLPLSPGNFTGVVAAGQSIRIFMSTARADTEEPLDPDLTTEIAGIEMAVIFFADGSITTSVTGDATALNPSGDPLRDSFLRINAKFNYEKGVEAALGPFATIDLVVIGIQFNGPTDA